MCDTYSMKVIRLAEVYREACGFIPAAREAHQAARGNLDLEKTYFSAIQAAANARRALLECASGGTPECTP